MIGGLAEFVASGLCALLLLRSTCCCSNLFCWVKVSMVYSCPAIQALARCNSDSLLSSSFSLLFSLVVVTASCLALALSSVSPGGAWMILSSNDVVLVRGWLAIVVAVVVVVGVPLVVAADVVSAVWLFRGM